MNNSYASALVLSVAVLFSSSGIVQGQSINQAQCLYDNKGAKTADLVVDATEDGNYRRTYENLCNVNVADSTVALDPAVSFADSAPTFVTFCNLLREPTNSNVLDFIAKDTNQHTLFAPTDSAFASISGALASYSDTKKRRILELHVVPGSPKLVNDLVCDGFLTTLDTQNDLANRQQSKTKCLTGGAPAQIGPGNVHPPQGNGMFPEIGNPIAVFKKNSFKLEQPTDFVVYQNQANEFSRDVVSCNGVIQIVDNVLLPGFEFEEAKGGKSMGPSPPFQYKSFKSGKSFKSATPYFSTSRGSAFGNNAYGAYGKADKKGKRRELFDEDEDENYEENEDEDEDKEQMRENRKQRLLELLVEPDGSIEQVNELIRG